MARYWIHVDIIDPKEVPSTLSRAVGILPNGLQILGPSGLTEMALCRDLDPTIANLQ